MIFVTTLMDFGYWWLRELRAMFPRHVDGRGKHVQADIARIILSRDGKPANQIDQSQASGNNAHSDASVRTRWTRRTYRTRRLELVIAEGRYLERTLAPFRLPHRRMRDMAVLDVASATPLDPACVFLLFPLGDPDGFPSRYFIVKREILEAVVGDILQGTKRNLSLQIQTRDGLVPVDGSSILRAAQPGRIKRFMKGMVGTAVTLCSIAAIATYGHAQWRLAVADAELNARIRALSAEVKLVHDLSAERQKRMDQIKAVRTNKARSVPLVAIWEELTKVLPDDAWLRDFAMRENAVTISGVSVAAGGLIAKLDESALFAEPSFTAPVTKAPGNGGESFTIRMDIVQ